MPLKPGMSFLNIGSGTGYFSCLVAEVVGECGVNDGLELWPENVVHAQERCASLGKYHIEFNVGNVYQLDVNLGMRYDRIYVKHRIPLVSSCRHRIAKAVYEAAPTAALKRLPPEPKGSQHKDAETFFIDLAHLFGDPEHALEKLRKVSPLDRATYTRVAVFGFAILHLPTLSDMLKELPDVQELVLPDLKLDETSRLHLKHFALESQLSHSTKITFLDRVEVSVWQLFGD